MSGIPRAIHLPGGNFLDDVRLDIVASHEVQSEWLEAVEKRSVRRSRIVSTRTSLALAAAERAGVLDALVEGGFRRAWFEEFRDYWQNALGGRPIGVPDFHQLRFHYRRGAQLTTALSWRDGAEHLKNWQRPENLASTFQLVHRSARMPKPAAHLLPRIMRRDTRGLEYGCSLAPFYRSWRAFHSHVPMAWVLADIPGFPFHFARHAYAHDAEASFVLIEQLDDPLAGVEGTFDLIIVREVFEHLDRPRAIAEYLLDRLSPGGLMLFDYICSDATAHDTPAGLAERTATLDFLGNALEIVDDDFHVDDRSLGACLGRRRA
jgi:SAM-dependent methyltransferase